MSTADKKPTFAGEVQFAGYSDSSRSGPRVTLRLADRDDLERFIGCENKRYMAVLMEIADDETPAPAPSPAAPKVQRERMAPLCEWAVMRCGELEFQRWACQTHPSVWGWSNIVNPADAARYVIVTLCGIESRKELDTNPEAAKRLHERVRKPYAAWLAQQGVPA